MSAGYIGDFAPGDIIDFNFNTSQNGAPITLAGTPTLRVLKNNDVAESSSGITLTVDFDARTGLHHVRITTTSDETFYAAKSNFEVVINAGTLGGVSVAGMSVGSFSIQNRTLSADSMYAGKVTSGTTTTLVDPGLVQADTDHWKGRVIIYTSGTLKYQAANILAFNPATDTLTHSPLTGAPSNGDRYIVV